MAPAWDRVVPPLPSTGSKRIASIGRDSFVMQHERERDWDAFTVHVALYALLALNASAKPLSCAHVTRVQRVRRSRSSAFARRARARTRAHASHRHRAALLTYMRRSARRIGARANAC